MTAPPSVRVSDPSGRVSDGPAESGPRRRASADAPSPTLTIQPTIAVGGMASARAPWEGIGEATAPRRRRSAPVERPPVWMRESRRRDSSLQRFARHVWERIAVAWRPPPEPEYGVDPSEWVPAAPAPYATARSFLPSRGLVVSTLVAIGAWAWVGTCLQTVDPRAPYALIAFLGGVAVGIAAVLAPALRVLAMRYGRTRAFRDASWWHGIRQGALVGLAVAVNGLLLAFRQWAPIGAVAVGFGACAVEGIILAVLLSARGRSDAGVH